MDNLELLNKILEKNNVQSIKDLASEKNESETAVSAEQAGVGKKFLIVEI